MRASRSNIVFRIAAQLVILFVLCAFSNRLPKQTNDLTEYWSSAHLLLTHQNPYDPNLLQPLERMTGKLQPKPLVMLNPPWIFPIILSLAFVTYPIASAVWIWANLFMIFFSIQILWELYAGYLPIPSFVWLFMGCFLPIYIQIVIGQIGAFVLLGITGFLYWQQQNKDLLAGLSVFLVTLKPHIALLFLLAVAIWIIQAKKWKFAVAFLFTISMSSLLPLFYKSDVFGNYSSVWRGGRVNWQELPSISGLMVRVFHCTYLVFLPLAIATLWLVYDWIKHSNHWNWIDQTPLLLLVSIVVTPYSWLFDQVLLIPIILQIAANRHALTKQKLIFGFYAGINTSIVVFFLFLKMKDPTISLFHPWAAWIAPAWLALYLLIRWNIANPHYKRIG